MESPGGQSPRLRSYPRARTSLLNTYRPHSKFNSSARLNQAAQVIFKTSQNTGESFGLPLPVLVTETLTFADSNAHISARLSPEGWGWVVCGRRLLVWQYRDKRSRAAPSTPTTGSPVTCYELTLPQTDLAHKAELVCVFNADGNQIPSCIGVSPEGVVRYWHSVAHEGGYIEKTADLHGQECDSLVDANPVGCVLATTTCTVVLVQSNLSGGRHNITTRTLQGSGGWLGGLSRRVSSLFFSAMPTSHSVETKLVGVAVLGDPCIEEGARVCVVAGLCAQLWQLGTAERLAAEIDLQRTLRDAFLHASMFPPGDPASLDVHILDMQSWNGGLLLFVAAVNTVRSPQMRYALAHMCTDEDGGSGHLLGFVPLQATVGISGRPGTDSPSGGPHMLSTSSTAMLYDRSRVIVVSSVTPNDKPDIIELNGDQILGAGLCYGIPLFFSKMHGVISVVSNEKAQDISLCDSPIASPRPSDAFDGHLSLYEIDPRAVIEASETAGQGSTAELLKAAFLHHMRREHVASRKLLADIFPPGEETMDVDSPLDRTVLAIATDLVNDIPASDPRWSQANAGNSGAALGSSSSLQIGLQLQDKRRAFSLLLEFLRSTGLWTRLGGATMMSAIPAPTVLLLRSLAEKITAAITLRTLQQQSQHQSTIDTAVQQVMVSNAEEDEEETFNISAALTPSDLFYKNISRIERALVKAAYWCNEQDASGCAPPQLSQLISKVNHIIITVIQEVLKYRHQHTEFFSITPPALKLNLEYTTWTSCPKTGNLLDALCSQQALSSRRANRAPIELRGELRAQATSLAAAALEFTRERAESFPHESKKRDIAMREYAQMRYDMIQPLVDDEEYEHASSLAEKFHDFDILVTICEKSDNREKLYHYMNKYEDLGFQQQAFRWFMNRGRGGQASLLKAFPNYGPALSRWLAEQRMESDLDETENLIVDELESIVSIPMSKTGDEAPARVDGTELLWLHEVRADKWLQAANTLSQLAESETDSVNRMMIQSSLSKLCAYAAEDDREERKKVHNDIVAHCNYKLLLADHHSLPSELLASHGLDADNMRVMEPRDIVDMFITYNGSGLTEYDYSRALELCELINNSEQGTTQKDVNELRRRVWCSTILADSWDEYDKDSPISTIQDKLFFKVVNAVHLLDCNLDDYLIPLEDLLQSPELKEIVDNKIFLYLMRAGYEHVYQSQDENMLTD